MYSVDCQKGGNLVEKLKIIKTHIIAPMKSVL